MSDTITNNTFVPRHNNRPRQLQDLDLLDPFLFGVSTENPKHAELIARIIVERATGRRFDKVIVETEKQLLGTDTKNRGIRMDMHITEYNNEEIICIYDIEPNNYYDKHLPKRTRYYQALSDTKSLSTGQPPEKLPDFISIWILPYDPFGENRMIYTVKNLVAENPELVYNDGVIKLLLYVDGEVGGSNSLHNLLKYMSDTNPANAVDSDLAELQAIINSMKQSKEVRKRYMDYETMRILAESEGRREGFASGHQEGFDSGHQEGFDSGHQEGLRIGILALADSLKQLDFSYEQIINTVTDNYPITREEVASILQNNNIISK